MNMLPGRLGADDLAAEVTALRKELRALSRDVSKRGRTAYRAAEHDVSEIYADVAEKLVAALPVIRRRAHDVERVVRDNPTRTIAVVGLAAMAIAAFSLLGSRRR